MPTGVFDASLVTMRKRNCTLNAFYKDNNAAILAGTSVRREQPSTQLQEIVTQRHETNANTNPTGDCACSDPYGNNPGGNVSNRVQ